ncbi:MAG: phosphoserine phosphatase SerB [Pseudolabrys sp.]|nr:phosphoserine phosphatase SerB [Pseudolabrys sp.]MDP2295975.1 phosphoserine phosphatase SerB [Pseudolabrys sp.]
MTHIATLIGPDALNALRRASAAFPRAGEPVALGPDAADIPFTPDMGTDQRAAATALREAFGAPYDVVVQPSANRRKKLFLADMDSTMIGQECIDELADFVGLKAHVAAITERAMRGEIEFEPALRERVALLKGLPVSVVDDVIEKHITLTPGGRALVNTMRAHGGFTCLVSGGFTLFTGRIAAMIGFDEARANVLMLDGDRLAGQVREPIFGRQAKRATLIELRDRLGLAAHDTLVTGDGANDLDMIVEAGLGVAYHAKPKVAAAAPARIEHNDLTALLYAQGYRRDEFVQG